MMKSSIKIFLTSFFLFNPLTTGSIFATSHTPLSEDSDKGSNDNSKTKKKTIPFNAKFGAGNPHKKNPNGTKSYLLTFEAIPCATSMDSRQWLSLGDSHEHTVTHYIGALPSINLISTLNIFTEYLQFSLLPGITKDGHILQEDTVFSKALHTLDGMLSQNPHAKHKKVSESHVGCHFFMPKVQEKDAGAVLLLPGSKGARLSEMERARTYARQGIPCLIPDFVSTDKTNHDLEGNSTIGNQLLASFFGRALNINILHQFLQEMEGTNANKVVWDCESIGSTQALLALMPEVIEKFEPPFIPPVFISLNDCAPILTTTEREHSLFWETPKTIRGGEADEFTPLLQVRNFLSRGPGDQKTDLKIHGGHHDARSVDADTLLQAGETYRSEDATNYTGLCVSMRPPVKEIRKTIEDLKKEASPQEIIGVLGGIFESVRVHLDVEDKDLGPKEVMARLGALPTGATLGPSSEKKADELRDEVITDILKHVK